MPLDAASWTAAGATSAAPRRWTASCCTSVCFPGSSDASAAALPTPCSRDRARQQRHACPRVGERCGIDQPGDDQLMQDAPLLGDRAIEVLAMKQRARRRQQAREERGLEDAELGGTSAKVGSCGLRHAPQAIAPFDDVEIELEDAALVERALQPARDQGLAKLAVQRARGAAVEVAHELL